jgi:hypothetical protein
MSLAVRASAGACDLVPEGFAEEGPRFGGLYENGAWGYSVRIPEPYGGYNNSAGPQHGLGLILGESRNGYIFVDGEANSLEFQGPYDAAIRSLAYAREDEETIVATTITRSHLGRLPARELTITYTCATKRYVQISIFAIGPRSGVVYEITLNSTAGEYRRNRAVLDQMAQSWRYFARDRQPAKSSGPAPASSRTKERRQ